MRARYVTADGRGGTWVETEGDPPDSIQHTWPSGLVETLYLSSVGARPRMVRVSLYPKKSMSIGCAPWQRKAMMRRLEKLGVPTEIDHRGRAVFTSRQHQNAVCKALGYKNLDAGYGDHS